MKQSKISILVPIYNAEKFLGDCLTSIISQSYINIEIILINDGSADNSLSIAKKFASKDSRIKIINQKNAGVSAARNAGLDQASGEYVLFIDSDDYLPDTQVINKIHAATLKKGSVVMYNIIYEGKKTNYPLDEEVYSGSDLNNFLFEMIKNEHFNSPCNKLYRKEILDKHAMRFNEKIKIGEDLLFNIEYFKHCNSVYYLNDNLYFYRTSNISSATSTYKKNKYLDLMIVNDALTRWTKTRSKKLVNISKYIRIKNILSCLRDLANDHLNSAATKTQILQYKKSNQRLIVLNCGIKLYLISLAYSHIDIRLIYMLIATLYRKPKKEIL